MSTFNVLVNGRRIDNYNKDGKKFVEGRKGSSYEIEFYNSSTKRKKIIVSVDGLNVVSGDNNWEHGYVVEPYQTLVIPGWRKDAGNVAKFVFSSLKGSYNQHNDIGDKLNIGVIGCKVFDEVEAVKPVEHHYYHHNYYPYYGPYYYTTPVYTYPTWVNIGGGGFGTTLTGGSVNLNASQPATTEVKSEPFIGSVNCSYTSGGYSDPIGANLNASDQAKLSQPLGNLCAAGPQSYSTPGNIRGNAVGTGWGANQQFQTHDVNYQFKKEYSEMFLIFYDDRRGLERRGIDLYRDYQRNRQPEPQAFPSSVGCPPPK